MKKILSIVLILLSTSVAFAQTEVKVMTFNIHAASDATIEELAAFIQTESPDIVALQEVDFYTDRSNASTFRTNNNHEDMLTSLAYLTGMQGMFFPAINVYGGKYGNAILSKLGFEATRSEKLSYVSGSEKRVAAIAAIQLPDNQLITFICAHLDMSSQDNGLNQIKELNKLAQSSTYPILLGGDLNKRVGSPHINELATSWTLALSDGFDHIAYYPENNWIVKETKVYSDNKLSDHLPLMVTFQLK